MRPWLLLPLLLFSSLLLASRSRADLPLWSMVDQSKLVRCLMADAQGRVWVGTEDKGVWEADPSAPEKGWRRYRVADGLGEDSVTALACDPKGRVWVGHPRRGVSVFNGTAWKTYDATTGPLGQHVFALAVSPKDGDVWIATEAGLARYSQSGDTWRSYTRADGLPADQAEALAFAGDGTLYVGTQCETVAVGSPADDFAAWRHVLGPPTPSPAPAGGGLPSCRINALLVTRGGTVYAGTPSGLAGSSDGGKSWTYLRGSEWLDKARGATRPPSSDFLPPDRPTLAEDWITTLAEDAAGRLWIGHRTKSLEVFDPVAARPTPLPAPLPARMDDVSALLVGAGPQALVGGYGGGMAFITPDPAAAPWAIRSAPAPAPMPTPARPPTVAEMHALTASLSAAAPALKPGGAAFLGDDWVTQGDWVGRYGNQCVRLYGTGPTYYEASDGQAGYGVDDSVGPHSKPPAGPYTFIAALNAPDLRFPFSPRLGHRRDAEANDGSWDGSRYSPTWEGPDLWITLRVPSGTHRASFYFVNNDGHVNNYRWRDYFLELKADAPTREAADRAPALARARVAEFYGGVYKNFLVQGPATFQMKIGRAYSYCTKVQGVFLDRLAGPSDTALAPTNVPLEVPYLGATVSSTPGTPDQPKGLLILSVVADSPAAEGGIQPGDLLTEAGHTPLTSPEGLIAIVRSQSLGKPFLIQAKRGAQTVLLPIALHSQPTQAVNDPAATATALASYSAPAIPAPAPGEPETLTAARALWAAADDAQGHVGGEAAQMRARALAYRAALSAPAPPALLDNWRWHLGLWTNADRAAFDRATVPAAPPAR